MCLDFWCVVSVVKLFEMGKVFLNLPESKSENFSVGGTLDRRNWGVGRPSAGGGS